MLNAMYLFSIRSNFKQMNGYLKIRNRTEHKCYYTLTITVSRDIYNYLQFW